MERDGPLDFTPRSPSSEGKFGEGPGLGVLDVDNGGPEGHMRT